MPGIYISYPFCSQKCTFCNFASGVFPREMEGRYLAAVEREIRGYGFGWRPETVYLGGGTPSGMSVEELGGLLRAVPGRPWTEATMEAAPGTLTAEKVRGWREAGINRVSLGVQSFVTEELRRTGRRHTAETVSGDVELLRAGGISNISVDLIAGLPRQTAGSWAESLVRVRELGVPHASVYMLEVDEESRLGAEILLNGQRYGANETPGEDAVAAMYEAAVAEFAAEGLARYEISNFARAGFESKHNLKYWELAEYVGFGADAHSFDGGRRWGNADSVEGYMAAVAREYSECGSDEKFFVGLRLMRGVVPDAAEWERYAGPIGRFVSGGLLERHEGALRLTDRGVMVSNEVFQEFLNA